MSKIKFKILLCFAILGFLVVLASRTPSSVEAAEYVGSDTCIACHEEQGEKIKFTSHYRYLFEEEEVEGGGCESCHGPGEKHSDSSLKKDIVRYSSQVCFSCHMGKKAEFNLQHHHPVAEGKMKCIDCHGPHDNEMEFMSATSLQKSNETCFKCHKEMKGPFIYEHDPMREGCQTCHNPHGSVYDKMLIADQTNLCLRCHWQPSFNTSGGELGLIPHGNYYIGRGEECLDHHRAPHGSNIWKTLNR